MIHAITDGVRRIDHVPPVGDRRERRRQREFPELPDERDDDSEPAPPTGPDAPSAPREPVSDEDGEHRVDIRVRGFDMTSPPRLPGGQSLPAAEPRPTLH